VQQSPVPKLRHVEKTPPRSRVLQSMSDSEIYDEASDVDAEEGAVVVKGPDAVDVRMTPGVAEETSEKLLEGAMKARGQRYFEDQGS
jgi:hypothetical protein